MGTTLVVDTFAIGSHSLSSSSGNWAHADIVDSALGSTRGTRIYGQYVGDGSYINSSVDGVFGSLTGSFFGSSLDAAFPLALYVDYFGGGPFSVSGASGFEVDFPLVQGSGFLLIELGIKSNPFGPDKVRIPVNQPGTIFVPIESVNIGAPWTAESFLSSRFVFEAKSAEFSFILDEIRIVPEPTTGILLLTAGIWYLSRRKRADDILVQKDEFSRAFGKHGDTTPGRHVLGMPRF